MACCAKKAKKAKSKPKEVKYKVRILLGTWITVAMIVILIFSAITLITGFNKLISKQVAQVIRIPFIKKEQIRSVTYVELK